MAKKTSAKQSKLSGIVDGGVKLVGVSTYFAAVKAACEIGMPSLLIGETGTGKTSVARAVAHDLGRKLVRVNLDGGTTPDELVGRFQLKGSETYFQEGILPKAMRDGAILLLDELNAALPDTLFALQAVLEDRGSRLIIPETNEEIVAASGFAIIATMNPSQDYAGTKALNHALYSRFGCVCRFVNLSGERIIKALTANVTLPEGFDQSNVLKIAELLEKLHELRLNELVNTRVSIREGIAALRLMVSGGLSLEKAIDAAIISRFESFELVEIKKAALLNENHIPIESGITIETLIRSSERVKELEQALKGERTDHAAAETELKAEYEGKRGEYENEIVRLNKEIAALHTTLAEHESVAKVIAAYKQVTA